LPRVSPRVLWGARHFLRFQLPGAAAKVRADDFAYVDELWRRWSPGWRVPPGETRAVKEAFRQPGCLDAALGYYRAVNGRVPAALRRPITVPSVVLCPERDGILRRADYERARRCFAARHDIVDVPGGHFCHRQHPERVIPALVTAARA
jgi:pimeloyl-ACP methyl ester carboxylesterase